jgi:hypothetical protein
MPIFWAKAALKCNLPDKYLMPAKESHLKVPPYWSDDPLSAFMTDAFKNSLASFVRRQGEYQVLLRIHRCFAKACDNLSNPPNFLAAVLIVRSHAAYLAAVRLAMSGQLPETFPLLRTTLEYAFYALHIDNDPESGVIWLQRHETTESLKAIKKTFQHVAVMGTLKSADAQLHATLEMLYERTIDFGGHPNERGVAGSMTLTETEDRKNFGAKLLDDNELALAHAAKTSAQIGTGALCIFEIIFRDRFRLLGIDLDLESLKSFL